MTRERLVLGLTLGLASTCCGCGSGDDAAPPPASSLHVGGQTGGEAGIRCAPDVAVQPLGFDAASPLGFSANDLAHALPASAARPLAWTDGTSAVLDLSFAYTGAAGYAKSCRSNAADVTLTLGSSDGALDETASARVFAGSLARGSLDLELAVSTLAGSLATSHPTLVTGTDHILVQIDLAAPTTSGRVLVMNPDASQEIAAF